MCTSKSRYTSTPVDQFWEVDLQLDNSTTPSKWEIVNATLLAKDYSENNGDFSFIPSGLYKNDIVFTDFSGNAVKMMKFDASGRPVVQGGADPDTALKPSRNHQID